MNESTEENTILETKRLLLRKWETADAHPLFEILSDETVVRDIGDGRPFSFEQTRRFIEKMQSVERENGFCRWKTIEKRSGALVGTCGFGFVAETGEIELGYLLGKQAWGQGYATEIARAALNFGFNKLNFREIIALTALENTASHNVLLKIGFEQRGIEIYKAEENLVFYKKNSDE